MTSLNFQLRISLLFFVGLTHNLVREIWVVHVNLRSYKISCVLVGQLDNLGQWQGQCIFFLSGFIFSIHNSAISWPRHFKFSTVVVEKRNFQLTRYYVTDIFKLEYLRYLLSELDQIGFGESKMTMTFFSLKYFSMSLPVSQTYRHSLDPLVNSLSLFEVICKGNTRVCYLHSS